MENIARLGDTRSTNRILFGNLKRRYRYGDMQICVRGPKGRKQLNSVNICGLDILYDCKLNP